MSDIREVMEWLAGGALSGPESADVLAQLCQRMIDAGIPLWRAAVFVTTLHPDVMGRRFLWQAESGVTTSNALHSLVDTDDYRKSPFTTVFATRQPLRRHLADADCPADFEVVQDLRAQGATDYAAFPLVFTDGTIHVATWSTRQPGGFTPKQFADLEFDHRAVGTGGGNPRAAAHVRKSDRHLCRTSNRREDSLRQDPPRLCRGDPRRGLAVGHARLHDAVGAIAAAGPGRSLEPLFRLPGAGGARSRRRGAQVHGRRPFGDFSDRQRGRRRRGVPTHTFLCARVPRAHRGAAARR